jgi:hypothetical protein
MTKAKALVLIHVAMLVAFTAACIGLSAMDAEGDAFVLAMLLIGGSAALGSSETVAYYAHRDENQRRQSHNPPPSG